jgi:flagellar hook-basal body protein
MRAETMNLQFCSVLNQTLRVTCAAVSYAAMAFSISALVGCDAPTSNEVEAAFEEPSGLDAESGKDRFNAYSFQQGELTPTNNPYDMAINGAGLFVLANQVRKIYFRRPATFLHDANGHFILGNPDTRLQGIKLWDENSPYANSDPTLTSTNPVKADQLTTIHLPFQMQIPPKATTSISILGNLPAYSYAKGSIIYSQRFLHHAEISDQVIALSDGTGMELGMQPGDILTISKDVNGTSETTTMMIKESSTLGDIAKNLQSFLQSEGARVKVITPSEDIDLRGALTVHGNHTAIHRLQFVTDRPISSPKVSKTFSFLSTIPAGTTAMEMTTDRLRSPAKAGSSAADSDILEELFDTNGNMLGLENGDEINISGTIGGIPANHVAPLTYQIGDKATTMRELLDRIKDNFKLPDRDGTPNNHLSVSLNEPNTYDNIPDGSIVIRGLPGTEFNLGSIVVNANNFRNQSPTPSNFNANMFATTLRSATDPLVKTASAAVYDSMGIGHTLWLSFTPSNVPSEWLWKAEIVGSEGLWTMPTGLVRFHSNGLMADWTIDENKGILEQVKTSTEQKLFSTLKLDLSGPVRGLTQYGENLDSRTILHSNFLLGQNGFPSGILSDIAIDELGQVVGTFTNGYSCALYQIALADFPNKQGLKSVGANSFIESVASGSPVYLAGSSGLAGALLTQHIEASPR